MARFEHDKQIGWDCGKCEAIPGKKRERGCTSDTGPVWTMGGEDSRRCPKARILYDTDPAGLIQTFNFLPPYRNGLLPLAGGVMDQPAIAIQLLDVGLEEIIRLENEDMKRERDKLKEPTIKRGRR